MRGHLRPRRARVRRHDHGRFRPRIPLRSGVQTDGLLHPAVRAHHKPDLARVVVRSAILRRGWHPRGALRLRLRARRPSLVPHREGLGGATASARGGHDRHDLPRSAQPLERCRGEPPPRDGCSGAARQSQRARRRVAGDPGAAGGRGQLQRVWPARAAKLEQRPQVGREHPQRKARSVATRATHGALLPHRAPSPRSTAESVPHVWLQVATLRGVRASGGHREAAASARGERRRATIPPRCLPYVFPTSPLYLPGTR